MCNLGEKWKFLIIESCIFMRSGQLSRFGVLRVFDLATIIVRWFQYFYRKWKVGIWAWWKKKWVIKVTHTVINYTQAQKKKATYFFCSRAYCQGPAPLRTLGNSIFKTGKTGLFIAWADSKTWGAWTFFSVSKLKFVYKSAWETNGTSEGQERTRRCSYNIQVSIFDVG
jgi:hypothetical protein